MPPKSAKKEQKTLWSQCDDCKTKIHQNKLKIHEKECQKSSTHGISSGILNETYHISEISHFLPPEVDVKDAPDLFLQQFIFIPETICGFCSFSMGSNLLVEVEGRKYVMKSWTISDKHQDLVFSSAEELKGESNFKISRFPLTKDLRSAQRLDLVVEGITETKDIERLIKAKLRNSIIHPSNTFVADFLNKKFTFSIKSVGSLTSNDLAEEFSQIDLSDEKFYIIDHRTLIRVSANKEEKGSEEPKLRLDQIGGLEDVIQDLKKAMDLALGATDIKISRAVLIHGLPGSGKTMLCHAFAGSYPKAHKIFIDSWKIFSKFYGESEANLKKHFDEAVQMYPTPTVIVIDELSNICPKNDASDAVRRVSSLLGSLIDTLHTKMKIFILANTNNPDNVDPAIRRSGRLDYEVELPVPNTQMREKILANLLRIQNHQLLPSEISEIAKRTHGYVGGDLESLISKSLVTVKVNGKFSAALSAHSILSNLASVKPSAMRELLIEKPNVKWTDIGGMKELKMKLKQIVEWPLTHPETFERLGIKPPRGLLMFGPPGCSKTMIAKALATESNLNFISIKGSDLFSMWVGESEKAVRDLFVKARQLSPCIIFFDEIDAIGGERSAESGSSVKERVLAQILTEIDGVNVLKNVIIIAATNRPDLIDQALMRPGRLDRIVYVTLPDAETREEIFKIKLAGIPVAGDVKIEVLVKETDGYSGAEIEAVCKEASLKALEHSFDIERVEMKYFEQALKLVKPRISEELLQLYRDYENRK